MAPKRKQPDDAEKKKANAKKRRERAAKRRREEEEEEDECNSDEEEDEGYFTDEMSEGEEDDIRANLMVNGKCLGEFTSALKRSLIATQMRRKERGFQAARAEQEKLAGELITQTAELEALLDGYGELREGGWWGTRNRR